MKSTFERNKLFLNIHIFLTKCQIEKEGYTGTDVAKLVKSIHVSRKTLRKRINRRISNDPAFKQLRYLGKPIIPLTLDGFILSNNDSKRSL